MKPFFVLSAILLTAITAYPQNTAVITQQGGSHGVSVSQQGNANTSVINQARPQTANRAVVSQSGSGNVATISQGNTSSDTTGDSATGARHSVNTTQSGEGETIINQREGGNSISVYQSGKPPAALPTDKETDKTRNSRRRKPAPKP